MVFLKKKTIKGDRVMVTTDEIIFSNYPYNFTFSIDSLITHQVQIAYSDRKEQAILRPTRGRTLHHLLDRTMYVLTFSSPI